MKTALGRNDVLGELFVESVAELIGLGRVTTQFLYTVDFPIKNTSAEPEQTKLPRIIISGTGRFHLVPSELFS